MGDYEIVPSILSADFARLADDVQAAAAAGIRTVQVDVMDGRFVPNISVGLPVVKALRKATDMRLDVHLMIVEPERYVEAFVDAGADVVSVHVEATPHIHRAMEQIRSLGVESGVALNPGTPLVAAEEVFHLADLVLVMTVNPGFGGQAFIPQMMGKVAGARRALDRQNPTARVQVDGGIGPATAGTAVEAGAYDLVAGSAIFNGGPVSESVRRLDEAAREGLRARVPATAQP